MANPTTPSTEHGRTAAEKAKEAASSFGDKAREAASSVGEAVSSAASSVGSTVSKTAERVTTATGSGVRHLGDTIKDKGPQEGVLGSATRAVASTLQEGGKYIEQEGFNGMMEDVSGVIRRNPFPALLVAVGIGFLIGRSLGGSHG